MRVFGRFLALPVILGLVVLISALACEKEKTQDPGENPTATPTATIETTPTEAPPEEIAPQVSAAVSLEEGLTIFRMSHDGASNFAIFLLNQETGEQLDLLVNVIGSFDGAKAVGIEVAGNYVLDISADGNWTVTAEQPRPSSAPSAPQSFSGQGQSVSPAFTLEEGLATFRMTHDGTSNFAIFLLDANGQQVELSRNYPLDVGETPHYYSLRRRRRKVTVCIAALCTWGGQIMVVGASDRMLTAEDIEFEPPRSKISYMSPFIVALTAGDSSAQTSICTNTRQEVNKLTAPPVAKVADIYARQFAAYRAIQAAQTFLAPLGGLTLETFITHQRDMAPELVSRVTKLLMQEELEAQGIITGIDATGAHLYVVRDPGHSVCNDGVGFAAIGIGQWHAESQFMFASYTSEWSFERSLLLTYQAKKRAEVAPGVGKETDMFFIGPGATTPYTIVNPDLLKELDTIYNDVRGKEIKAGEEGYRRLEKYVQDIIKKITQAAEEEQQRKTDNEAGVRASATEGEPKD